LRENRYCLEFRKSGSTYTHIERVVADYHTAALEFILVNLITAQAKCEGLS